MDVQAKLDRVFHPKVLAVVGAKRDNNYRWLRSHQPFTAFGKVYHVNTDRLEWPGAEELGFPNVASLLDIPEPVDYVAISVPNKIVPAVLRDCVAKGVGGAHVYAAGFAETGADEGIQLEDTLRSIAEEGDLLMIGPNAVGIYHPALGMRPGQDLPHGGDGGYFSYISQSGSTTQAVAAAAPANGIEVAKGVSFGNGTIADSTDFLRYFAADDATEMIGLYLEGVRNGPAFFDALRAAAARKPVLVWKVGSTAESARAGVAHTASERVPAELWDAMLTVSGAIKVTGIDEMLETAMALRYVGDPGLGAALVTISGGHSGKIADVFGHQGFRIPSPNPESLEEIGSYAELDGGSFRNPFEGPSVRGPERLGRTLDVLGRDDGFDTIVFEFAAGSAQRDADAVEQRIELLRSARERQPDTPIVTVVSTDVPYVEGVNFQALARPFFDAGFACFPSMERAAVALRNAREYHGRPTWLLAR